MANNEEFVMPPSFDARAVACGRGKFGNQTYDAELMVYGKQYLLAAGFPTREAAMAMANSRVSELNARMLAVVTELTKGLKEAKE